MKVIEIVF